MQTEHYQVFAHHIYEYKKGLRNLILHTTYSSNEEEVCRRLEREDVDYRIYRVTENKINVFFGEKECLEVIDAIGKSSLTEYSDEEDFILGIMLGYDRKKQCVRYIGRKNRQSSVTLAG